MIRLVLTSFALLLALTSVALGQFTFNFHGTGARSQGMGNAFFAVSDDASAVAWNPAGLVAIEGPMLGLNWGSMAPRGKTMVGGADWDASGSYNSIQQGAFVAPIRISGHRFVGSIGYSGNIEEYLNTGTFRDFDTTMTMYYIINNIAFDQTWDTRWYNRAVTDYHSNVNSINAGFGTQLRGNMSAGLAVNIYTGQSVRSTQVDFKLDPFFPAEYYPQAVAYRQFIEETDSVSYSGYNFTFGLKLDGEKFDAGLVLRSPFDLEAETGRSTFVTTTYNGTVQQGQSPTVFVDKLLTKYEIPWFIGFGGAYQVSSKLLAALDFEYRGFEGKKIKTRSEWFPTEDIEEFIESDMLYYDVVAFRFGLEYVMETESKFFPVVPIRVGYGYAQLPYSGADAGATVEQQGEEAIVVLARAMSSQAANTELSMGFGIYWSQIHLDMAYSYASHDLEFDLLPEPAEVQNRDHKVSLNFTGYF